jgi:hypothetical protein
VHSGVSLETVGNDFGNGTEDLINQFDRSPHSHRLLIFAGSARCASQSARA